MNNADNLKKIKHYFEKGLNATEIAKLLDLSPRTCQRYIKAAGIGKEAARPQTIREKAAELVAAGFSYAETAARLKISKASVYNWQRAARLAAEKDAAAGETPPPPAAL